METEPAGDGAAGSVVSKPLSSLPVIKNLASCNTKTRERSLRLLTTKWLPSQTQGVSDDDMKKLWKGLFYCLWHADKVPFQSDLINQLSSLLLTLHLPLSLHYFSTFLLTLCREWAGIDSLRLDKFYLLIRRFIHSMFLLLKKNGWDSELTNCLMGILEEKAFLLAADDSNKKLFGGNGVSYHIGSVFLEELKPFLPVSEEVFEILLKPFFSVMGKSQDKVLVGKIRGNVFDFLLKMGKSLLLQRVKGFDSVDNDLETVSFGAIALKMGLASRFYELGSSPDCFQGNRKVFFSLHEDFLKLEKDCEASGVEISIPEVKVQDDEEVPELIHIVANGFLLEVPEIAPEGGVRKSLKKKKKNKKAKDGADNRRNKKPRMENDSQNNNAFIADGEESLSNKSSSGGDNLTFSEHFKSNLQKEFEMVAAEEGLDADGNTSLYESPKIRIKKATISKKRKRAKSADGGRAPGQNGLVGGGSSATASAVKSGETSAKKVSFNIKRNVVWKPQSPLPPQSVRIPPSVTPRGSALKKGVPPGPIREMPLHATKRVIKKKKGRKVLKATLPAIKRMRKLQSLSI